MQNCSWKWYAGQYKKTKEIVFGSWARHNVDLLTSSSGDIEHVTHFKLFGVYIDSTLAWNIHIGYITKKAAQGLYFLKILKRSGLTQQHLLHYYVAAIRPILEYCSSLWAHNLPTYLSDQIESIQKRAIRTIHNPTIGMPYISALTYADLESLKHRRETEAREFIKKILSPTSCLHPFCPHRVMMPFWPYSETLTDSQLIQINYGRYFYTTLKGNPSSFLLPKISAKFQRGHPQRRRQIDVEYVKTAIFD